MLRMTEDTKLPERSGFDSDGVTDDDLNHGSWLTCAMQVISDHVRDGCVKPSKSFLMFYKTLVLLSQHPNSAFCLFLLYNKTHAMDAFLRALDILTAPRLRWKSQREEYPNYIRNENL